MMSAILSQANVLESAKANDRCLFRALSEHYFPKMGKRKYLHLEKNSNKKGVQFLAGGFHGGGRIQRVQNAVVRNFFSLSQIPELLKSFELWTPFFCFFGTNGMILHFNFWRDSSKSLQFSGIVIFLYIQYLTLDNPPSVSCKNLARFVLIRDFLQES